ncbi:MAG: glycoside hydrolase family 172 protein [Pontiella sp.]
MKINATHRYLISAAAGLSALAVQAKEPVSIESLLTEMVDRDSVARFPQIDFRLKQESSYNRASKTPDEPVGWFANKDFRNFIRTEDNKGRKEWVMMDHQGAGAIVRSWMPWLNDLNPDTDIEMYFYLDGAEEPVIVGNMLGLFDGTGMIPYPLAHSSLRSAVSFFPIPYAKSCKVTLNKLPFFYQFTFREYPEGTPVKTFSMKDFEAAKALTSAVGKRLLNAKGLDDESPNAWKKTLQPNQEEKLNLPSGAAAAIRELRVKLGNYDDPEVTRSIVLKIEFDGQETVWCPLGAFFGSGIGLNPFHGWYRTVAEDGSMTCRWVMPYKNSASVSIMNLGDQPVDVLLEVTTGAWKWDDRSMYFNAAWRGQWPVPTRPRSDWNYVTLNGRGVYVGDTLTIMNPLEKWWGEGDEKIWVDGEDFPSIFGTGTEDYYAYSWGGRSTDFYDHPFHAQPRSNVYNKMNRKTSNERNTQGYSTETRTRSLDTMPFGTSLQLDMEVWAGGDCDMGYGVGMYWYGDADTTSNRKPEPVEVLNVAPLPAAMNQATFKKELFKGAVESDQMEVLSMTGNMALIPQVLKKFKGTWNKNTQTFFRGAQIGDAIELRIPTSSSTAESLVLFATQGPDYGIIRLSVNGTAVGDEIDLYARKPTSSGPIALGAFDPVDGAHVLRVEVVGQNAESQGAFFGIDCVTLNEYL